MNEENVRATLLIEQFRNKMLRAERVGQRALGVHANVLPLVALIVSAILHKSLGAKPLSDVDGGMTAVLGVVLLLVSLLLRSGAEQVAEAR